ncbi:MAG: hypothetical protein AAFO94_04390 [Bacteroidota bacterium]
MHAKAQPNSYSQKSHRQLSMVTLFSYLKPYPYILLKHTDAQLADMSTSSDLDIFLSEADVQTLMAQLRVDRHILRCECIRDNAMTQVFLYFQDWSFLQVDFLHDFRRKATVYLDGQELLQHTKMNEEGIRVYSDFHLMEHVVLFNVLNGAGVPQKYLDYLAKAPTGLLDQFNQKYSTQLSDFSAFAKYNTALHQALLKVVGALPQNKGKQAILNRLDYYRCTLRKYRSNRGRIISFTGVDGAGKSTVLENVRQLLKEKYRREVVVLRHRPSLLPILSAYRHGKAEAEKRAAATLPRQGNNTSRISSFVRFGYYYLDYLFGQHYVHFKHIMRGRILLYDRYYFDFIVDGRRSNIDLGKALPRFLYRWVRKPDLNFFLYAPPEIILQRKQELDAEAIRQLTTDYQQLFQDCAQQYASDAYHCIENIELERTLQSIEQQYIHNL